jgi:hypothetical protein
MHLFNEKEAKSYAIYRGALEIFVAQNSAEYLKVLRHKVVSSSDILKELRAMLVYLRHFLNGLRHWDEIPKRAYPDEL